MDKKNIKIKDLCGKLNITRQQLNHIIKSNSTSIETLEKLSKELGVPVGYFFDETKKNEVNEPLQPYNNDQFDTEVKNTLDSMREVFYQLKKLRKNN